MCIYVYTYTELQLTYKGVRMSWANCCTILILHRLQGNNVDHDVYIPPFKSLNIRIPTIIPVEGRGLLIRGLHYSGIYCNIP